MSQLSLTSPVAPSFPPISYQGLPVLTTEMLAQAYEVDPHQIRQNFANNRERFVEGKHFFIITNGELKDFRLRVENFDSQISPKVRSLTLWTERGAARNAKMLNSERAWDVFELLEETFFRVLRADAQPSALGPDATLPLSTTEDRKPLRALVGSWAKLANAPFDACWNQLKAAFQLANIKELPQAWLPDALAWVQEKIDALPAPLPSGDRPPLYRDGAFHLPSPNPRHIPGPREAALMALWKDWGHRARELERQFRELSREVDACRGDLFAHAVSDLGRHADTSFSTDSLLDGLYASQTVAEDQFKWAMTSLMCQLRLCLNVAVAMGR